MKEHRKARWMFYRRKTKENIYLEIHNVLTSIHVHLFFERKSFVTILEDFRYFRKLVTLIDIAGFYVRRLSTCINYKNKLARPQLKMA